MVFRRLIAVCLSLLPLTAQSYQSSFSEVKFDRSKGSASFHSGVQVDAASGAASMNVPFGPGIGQRGLGFRPTFTMRLAPQLGISNSQEEVLIGLDLEGGPITGPQTFDHLYQRGWGSASLSPGTFVLPLNGGTQFASQMQASYSLPGGGGGSALGTLPAGMTEPVANTLIKRFGYGSNVVVSNTAGITTRTAKARLIQMGSSGHLIIGLKTGPSGDAITDEVNDYVGIGPGPALWDFPRRMLVVQGDVAYEFSYVNHRYVSQARPFLPVRNWLFSGHYMITKVMNRFGESLDFVYDNDGIGYTATWSTNPAVKIRVQVTGTSSVPINLLGGNGQVVNSNQTTVKISYQGISTPVTSYTMGFANPNGASGAGGVSTGDRKDSVPGPAGPPSGDAAKSSAFGQWSEEGDWDDLLTSIQPIFITQDATGERIDFKYITGPAETWGFDTVAPAVLSEVKSPTRTVTLDWHSYLYKISYSPGSWGSYSNSVAPRRPAYAYGVTLVDDTDGQQMRRVVHNRVVPKANWLTGPPQAPDTTPETWTATEFYDAIMLPDFRMEVHKFVKPFAIDNLSSSDGNMQYLAYLKHVEAEVRYYEPGVDWQGDLNNAPGAASSAYKVVVKDRFSLHTIGNSTGAIDKYATPYATRTRTWDKDSRVLVVEETTDFDSSNLGWTTSHKTSTISAAPTLSTEMRSLQSTGQSYVAYPSAMGGERKTVKTIENISTAVPEWFIGRVTNETASTQQDNTQFLAPGVALPNSQPPVAKVFDPVFNTLKSATVGASGGTQVTTTLTPQGASGLQAAQLQSAFLSATGVDLDPETNGHVGVSAYGYDSNGFVSSISQKPNADRTITVQQEQDELGRPKNQTDPNNKVTSFTWDEVGRISTITPPDLDEPSGITYPDSRTAIVSRKDQVSELRYNGFGEMILERRKDGNGAWSFKLYGYDASGRSVGSTVWMAGRGEAQEANWTKGNLTASASVPTTVPGPDRCVQWGTDEDGNRVCIATEPTTVTTYVTTPAIYSGSSTQYDKRGRAIMAIDGNGVKVQTEYLGAANAPVAAGYSPTYVGPIRKVTVGPGTAQAQVTYYETDGLGRLVRVTDAEGQKTEYKYDAADRVLQVAQYDGVLGHVQTRTWTYNELGWLKSLSQPESGLTTYGKFTPTGKPTTTNYAGREVQTAFDWMLRPRTVLSTDGSVNQSFTFDTAPGGVGKLAIAQDGGDGVVNGVSESYDYSSPANRLHSLITKVRGQSFTQTYQYDTYGNRIEGNTSHATWTQSFHSASGLPNVLSYGGVTVASTPWANYDSVTWQVLKIAYGNGVKSTFSYGEDQARLTSVAHLGVSDGPLAQWAYTYDPVGNLVREDNLLTGGTWDQYGYDKLNRLKSALVASTTYGDQLQSFTYDAFGNRTSSYTKTVTSWGVGGRGVGTATGPTSTVPTIVNATFDANDQAMHQHNQIPYNTSLGARYDAQGNLTQINHQPGGNGILMGYDALGRMTTISYGAGASAKGETYLYSAAGLRVAVEVRQGGTLQKTKFNVYNDGKQMVAQYEMLAGGALTWKRDIVYLGTREAAEFDGPAATGMHVTQVDHLGSPRVVTGYQGNVESKQKYLPFGELLEPGNLYKTSKGYTGHEQTDDSGVIYMQARFYMPGVGRFTSPDPGRDQHFELTQSWNIYSYVRNSPILNTDPTGMAVLENATERGDPSNPEPQATGSPSASNGIATAMDADGHLTTNFVNSQAAAQAAAGLIALAARSPADATALTRAANALIDPTTSVSIVPNGSLGEGTAGDSGWTGGQTLVPSGDGVAPNTQSIRMTQGAVGNLQDWAHEGAHNADRLDEAKTLIATGSSSMTNLATERNAYGISQIVLRLTNTTGGYQGVTLWDSRWSRLPPAQRNANQASALNQLMSVEAERLGASANNLIAQ